MTWLALFHKCVLPKFEDMVDVKVGSVWECDHETCRRHWRFDGVFCWTEKAHPQWTEIGETEAYEARANAYEHQRIKN